MHKDVMILQQLRNSILLSNRSSLDGQNILLFDVRDFSDKVNDIKQYLSEEELTKSGDIKVEKNRLLYCLRKGITRIVLSGFLDMAPKEIKYDINPYGKPFISNSGRKAFHFNISHSKEYLLIGIVSNEAIGVDIEKINPRLKQSILPQSVFSPEELALYKSYDEIRQLRVFYKAWVQKEAVSKAIGVGISVGFDKFSVNIDPDCYDEKYSLDVIIDDLKYSIKMRLKLESDYFLATALI